MQGDATPSGRSGGGLLGRQRAPDTAEALQQLPCAGPLRRVSTDAGGNEAGKAGRQSLRAEVQHIGKERSGVCVRLEALHACPGQEGALLAAGRESGASVRSAKRQREAVKK